MDCTLEKSKCKADNNDQTSCIDGCIPAISNDDRAKAIWTDAMAAEGFAKPTHTDANSGCPAAKAVCSHSIADDLTAKTICSGAKLIACGTKAGEYSAMTLSFDAETENQMKTKYSLKTMYHEQ